MTIKRSKDKRTERTFVLREIYRHYIEFKGLVTDDGRFRFFDHSFVVENEDGSMDKYTVEISFPDLKWGIPELAPRKREAFFYNVILDKLQREVAEIMGITTVSVGQYVEQAMRQLAERYFAEGDHGYHIERMRDAA